MLPLVGHSGFSSEEAQIGASPRAPARAGCANMVVVSSHAPTAQVPALPNGSSIELPGHGSVFVRDSGGTPGQPVLLLLHGWLATADLNWGFTYASLAEHFRVVAFDQRGHGRGLRGSSRFTIDTCALDGLAVLDALGIEKAIPVGYSMGGPIALQLARRRPNASRAWCCAPPPRRSCPTRWPGWAHRSLTPLTRVPSLIPDGRLRRATRARFVQRRATGPWQDWISAELEPSDPTALLAQAPPSRVSRRGGGSAACTCRAPSSSPHETPSYAQHRSVPWPGRCPTRRYTRSTVTTSSASRNRPLRPDPRRRLPGGRGSEPDDCASRGPLPCPMSRPAR